MECLTLKKSNCKNCYKCIRHCPVKSIRFSGNQAYIIGDECILCGRCLVVCPQNAKQIVSEKEKVRVLLQENKEVYVSLAPSFAANYEGISFQKLRQAMKFLGFADVEETAVGAAFVAESYEERMEKDTTDVCISSCCQTVNLLIQKYFPSLLRYLAPVLSPLQAHCVDIRKRKKDVKIVFVGPCVAKKDEAERMEGYADAVLTFEELTELFQAAKLMDDERKLTLPEQSEENRSNEETIVPENTKARLFPTAGGILSTMKKRNPAVSYQSVDGIENCISALQSLEQGLIHRCFLEMSACNGSCIGGPGMEQKNRSTLCDRLAVTAFAEREEKEKKTNNEPVAERKFPVLFKEKNMPSGAEIEEILRQMGKRGPEDELNCGTCGYNTCREKAIAVYLGKAELSMCLPYLKEKAESFSEQIFRYTPNGLIVLNEKLEVQQINEAAQKILNLRNAADILGDQVVRILYPGDFLTVLQTGRNVYDKRFYLAEYGKYVEETILYDREYHVLVCLLKDISKEVFDREKKESITRQTVETADRVVEKQMRIVQEIASLLGETAAETKIALTKLKETVEDESTMLGHSMEKH